MSTDVITSGRNGEAGSRRGGRPAEPGTAGQAQDARRPARPARRPRTDRPASPVLPASPVRPVSPARPPGPGRPGRTFRTGGPARQALREDRAGQEQLAGQGAEPARGYAAQRRHGRTPFVILLLGLLSGGMICLLVVNTTLAANSIEIDRLQQANAARTERVQQLQQEVTADRSAAVIEQEARKLGMRPDGRLRFVDLRTHSIRVGQGPAS